MNSRQLAWILAALLAAGCNGADTIVASDGAIIEEGGSGGKTIDASAGDLRGSGGSATDARNDTLDAMGSGGATGGGSGGAIGSGGSGSGGKLGSGGSGSGGKLGSGGSGSGGSGSGGKLGSGGSGSGGKLGSGGSGSGGSGSGGKLGSGGSGSGGTGAGGCTPPARGTPVGWAAVSGNGVTTTTGGGNATPTTVTSLSALNSALSGTAAKVIWVQGTIVGDVTVGSNKTIVGVCGGKIQGHIEVSNASNVIFHNLFISGYGVGNCALDPDYDSAVGCSSGADAVSVQKNSHHIWFDHCDVADGTDGSLDITNGANYVTISWTKFHYTPRTDPVGNDSTGDAGHRFSNLVGGTDKPSSYDDANALNVTWHHNWWADNVVERQARVRFGHNHFFNNLWTSTASNYCVRAGIQAKILLQNNVFSGVQDPHEFNSTNDEKTAYITSSGNLYSGVSGSQATGGGGTAWTTPTYTYTLDAASSVQAAVKAGVGPR